MNEQNKLRKEQKEMNMKAFNLFILKHENSLTDMYNSQVVAKIKEFCKNVSKQTSSVYLSSLK